MTSDPLGVLDLYPNLPPAPLDTDHWYWCRRHEVAEHVTEGTAFLCNERHGGPICADHSHEYCIRIGPFMTEREANRLSRIVHEGHWQDGGSIVDSPLGMEIEQ